MGEKCFCHFNGYEVKDAAARASILSHLTAKNPHGITPEMIGAAPAGFVDGYHCYTGLTDATLDDMLLTIVTDPSLQDLVPQYHLVNVNSPGLVLPFGVWLFFVMKDGNIVRLRGTCGGMTAYRTYKESKLKNESFEMDAQIPGWTATNPANTFQTAKKSVSGYSVVMIDNSTDAGAILISDPVPVTPGEEYIFSAAVMGDTTGSNAQVIIRFFDAHGNMLEQSQQNIILGNVDYWYADKSAMCYAPDGAVSASLVLASTKTSTGKIYFDAARLASTKVGANLLKNPNFDTPIKVPGWKFNIPNKSYLTSEIVAPGNGRICLELFDDDPANGMQAISDKVTVTPGVAYIAEVDAYRTPGSNAQLWIRFYNASGALVDSGYSTVGGENSWSRTKMQRTAPDGAVSADVLLTTTKTATGAVYFDNVDFRAETETEYGSTMERFTGWAWDNPPMIPGVEYKTAKMHGGKPVYTKRIENCKVGNVEENDTGIPVVGTKIVRFEIMYRCLEGEYTHFATPLPFYTTDGNLSVWGHIDGIRATVFPEKYSNFFVSIITSSPADGFDADAHKFDATIEYIKE